MAPRDTGLMETLYAPPSVSKRSIALSNALIARREPIAIEASESASEVFLARPTRPTSSTLWIGASLGAAKAALGLPPAALRRLSRGIEIVGADPEAVALFVEATLAKWLDAAETAHPGLSLALGGVSDLSDDAVAVDLHVRAGGVEHIAHLKLEPDAARTLIETLDAASPRAKTLWAPLTASVRLASVDVARADLRDLVVGDAVTLHGTTRRDGAQLCFGQTQCAALRIGEKEGRYRAMIVGPVRFLRKDDTMSDTSDPAEPGAQTDAAKADAPKAEAPKPEAADVVDHSIREASDIPVALDFDLGTVPLTVADLDGLSDGQIFDLSLDPQGAVRITSGGRLLGHGEIVDLGGTLGVRVTRLMTDKR